jgi:DNA polymerase III epsilon subunit-like protein
VRGITAACRPMAGLDVRRRGGFRPFAAGAGDQSRFGFDHRFRFPKLCTVAGMRRRYPGPKSYGLGKLCELYGIELETHHRALCDARATGHLFNLMNLKRESREPDRADEAA